MVAHTNPRARLVVELWRDGERTNELIARDGNEALAQRLIEDAAPLKHNDCLVIIEK